VGVEAILVMLRTTYKTRMKTWKWVAMCALILGADRSATAQPAPNNPPDAQLGFERTPQLSPQEQIAQSDSILSRMDAAAATVRHQLEVARTARDVVKTLCLNDKLSQLDVAVRSARDRQSSLQASVQRGDTELATHEYTILAVLRQRAEQLNAEANQCIGEEVAFVGATQVTSSQDTTLPGVDTTEYPPTDSTLVTSPPQCVSCTGMGP
jgi:hypothetical protein